MINGFRPRAALLAGRFAGWVSSRSGRGAGATLPGTVALRIEPRLLARLAEGRQVAVVSATNGKTTTTRMLAAALASSGAKVLSNTGGSNLERGVVAALMTDPNRLIRTVALEVDELALPGVAAKARPDLFVLGNLSRDQLDRMTECRVIVAKWQQMFATLSAHYEQVGAGPVKVVANADDPLVAAAVLDGSTNCPRHTLDITWVAVGQPWTADAASCPSCSTPWQFQPGAYACGSCGFSRPAPTWELTGMDLRGPQGLVLPLQLSLPGRSNRANSVLAVAASAVRGIDPAAALQAMSSMSDVGGRYAVVDYAGAPVRLLLAKNPAGWQEMLAQHNEEQQSGVVRPIVLALNARTADGQDTSWIWDVPFEALAGIPVVVSGERAEDLAVRLRYAGVDFTMVREPLAAVAAARRHPHQVVDLLATYTAFTAVRRHLGLGS